MHGAGERDTDKREVNYTSTRLLRRPKVSLCELFTGARMPRPASVGHRICGLQLDRSACSTRSLRITLWTPLGSMPLVIPPAALELYVQVHDSPHRFAAGVPIAGGHQWQLRLNTRKNLRRDIWTCRYGLFMVHSILLIPVEKSRIFVGAIRAAGGTVLYTEFP